MYSLLLLAVSSFLLALVLTPLFRNYFLWAGLVDRPDSGRKLHGFPIPRLGGVAIMVAVLGAYGLLMVSPLVAGAIIKDQYKLIWPMVPAVAVIFAVGLADDIIGLSAIQKLLGQVGASLLAYWAGIRLLNFGGFKVENEILAMALTVGWLLLCTNAFNLIDGVDGLASGVGLFATLAMLIVALMSNNIALAIATVPLAGALCGFLKYNFNPATIFLGDSGSLLIGFLLGCYGVIWSQKSATLLGMTAPLMALAIPLMDVGLSIVRRFLSRQPIFGADRGHIHHRLLDRGMTPRRVALMLYGVSGLGAGFSLLSTVIDQQYSGLVLVLFCAVTWVGVQNLGYVELTLAPRMLWAGGFRRALIGQMALRDAQESIRSSVDVDDCWAAVRKVAEALGYSHVEMKIAGYEREAWLCAQPIEGVWSISIPLNSTDYVRLKRQFCPLAQTGADGPFADMLKKTLALKQFRPAHSGNEKVVSARSMAAGE